MSLFSKALEKGLKSSLSLCGEVTVAEGGESSPSTARIRYRIAEHAAEFSFLLPGDAEALQSFHMLLSCGSSPWLEM
jgi:hypothetical protein